MLWVTESIVALHGKELIDLLEPPDKTVLASFNTSLVEFDAPGTQNLAQAQPNQQSMNNQQLDTNIDRNRVQHEKNDQRKMIQQQITALRVQMAALQRQLSDLNT